MLEGSATNNFGNLDSAVSQLQSIQNELWSIAVTQVRAGDNSDVEEMDLESINEMSTMALSFSVVIALMAALDAPQRRYLPVSLQTLTDLQQSMHNRPEV